MTRSETKKEGLILFLVDRLHTHCYSFQRKHAHVYTRSGETSKFTSVDSFVGGADVKKKDCAILVLDRAMLFHLIVLRFLTSSFVTHDNTENIRVKVPSVSTYGPM